MTVAELIELLSDMNPNAQVVCQKDSEGNGYSPLSGAEAGYYLPDSSYSGEFDTENDEDESDSVAAVVLFPVN
jgi:hypothetical protein